MSHSRITKPVTLGDGSEILMEIVAEGGEQQVGLPKLEFGSVIAQVRQLASDLTEVIEATTPTRASVELGISISMKNGQLTALLVEGTGTASFKITLEWSRAAI